MRRGAKGGRGGSTKGKDKGKEKRKPIPLRRKKTPIANFQSSGGFSGAAAASITEFDRILQTLVVRLASSCQSFLPHFFAFSRKVSWIREGSDQMKRRGSQSAGGKKRRWLTLSGRVKVRRLRKGTGDGEDDLVLPEITSLDNDRFSLPVELWYLVLCFASPEVLPMASCVCQTWRIIILKDILPLTARMYGRVCIVTGCTSGLGREVALSLAGMGAHVVMGCRNIEKAEAVKKELIQEIEDMRGVGNKRKATMKKLTRKRKKILKRKRANIKGSIASTPPSFEIIPLDLADFSSVFEFARTFSEEHQRLDVLVLNAAVVTPKKIMTGDGFETMFSVNHLGHFLLTNLLLDCLKETASLPALPSQPLNKDPSELFSGSKVICVGCDLGMSGDNDLAAMVQNHQLSSLQNPPHFDCSVEGLMSLLVTYAASKYCNQLFAFELTKKLKEEQVRGLNVHVVFPCPNATALWDGLRKECGFMLASLFRLVSLFGRKPWNSIQVLMQTAVAPQTDEPELLLWEEEARPAQGELPELDEEKAKVLWELSEKWVKLKEVREKEEAEEKLRKKEEKRRKKAKEKQMVEEGLALSMKRKAEQAAQGTNGGIDKESGQILEYLLAECNGGGHEAKEETEKEREKESEKRREKGKEKDIGRVRRKEKGKEKEKEKEKGAYEGPDRYKEEL